MSFPVLVKPDSDKKTLDPLYSLLNNDLISDWRDAFKRICASDPLKTVRIRAYFYRNSGDMFFYETGYPLWLKEKEYGFFVHFLSAEIYNRIIAEGADDVIIHALPNPENALEANKSCALENLLADSVRKCFSEKYQRVSIYGNFGKPVHIQPYHKFRIIPERKIQADQKVGELLPAYSIGVDVGGKRIKTVFLSPKSKKPDPSPPVDTDTTSPAALLQLVLKQIDECLAENGIERGDLQYLGITFPAPMYEDRGTGDAKILRLTNYEDAWLENRIDPTSFYTPFSSLHEDLRKRYPSATVAILNDANAFGLYELYNLKRQKAASKQQSAPSQQKNDTSKQKNDKEYPKTVIVLPIGTGPGYAKLSNEALAFGPQQGGHIVVHLGKLNIVNINNNVRFSMDKAHPDPGCAVSGCFAGLVSGRTLDELAAEKEIHFGNSARDEFSRVLEFLNEVAKEIANYLRELYEIIDAGRGASVGFYITGGLFSEVGKILLENIERIIRTDQRFETNRDLITVRIAENTVDTDDGGCIGAILYAQAINAAQKTISAGMNKPGTPDRLPATIIGNGIVQSECTVFLDGAEGCVITEDVLRNKIDPAYLGLSGNTKIITVLGTPEEIAEKRKSLGSLRKIIAVGSGTVIDSAKAIADIEPKLELLILPTTLSVNGMFTEKAIFKVTDNNRCVRQSRTVGTDYKTVIDFGFIEHVTELFTPDHSGKNSHFAAGVGEALSVKSARQDWHRAEHSGKENVNPIFDDRDLAILEFISLQRKEFQAASAFARLALTAIFMDLSLMNILYGTSRPKDGSEHILAFEIENVDPGHRVQHGSAVAFAALLMTCLYDDGFEDFRKLLQDLGLPTNPEELHVSEEKLTNALVAAKPRADKWTFFDRHRIRRIEAQTVLKYLFTRTAVDQSKGYISEIWKTITEIVDYCDRKLVNRLKTGEGRAAAVRFVRNLNQARRGKGRIIINAAGRIGEIAAFFGNQLSALGFTVLRQLEDTPEVGIKGSDLILTLSGSGQTASVVNNIGFDTDECRKLKSKKKPIFVIITATPESPTWNIPKNYNPLKIFIEGTTKIDIQNSMTDPDERRYMPYTSTFEMSVMLFLEGVIEALIKNDLGDYADESPEQESAILQNILETIETMLLSAKTSTPALMQADTEINQLIDMLLQIKLEPQKAEQSIYFFGMGRNNNIIRLFARRLQNIGYNVYVPGPADIISRPARGDVAIFLSNTGTRPTLCRKAESLSKMGEKKNPDSTVPTEEKKQPPISIVSITANKNAEIRRYCTCNIALLDDPEYGFTAENMKNDEVKAEVRGRKRAFEVLSIFIFEGISVALMNSLKILDFQLRHVPAELE